MQIFYVFFLPSPPEILLVVKLGKFFFTCHRLPGLLLAQEPPARGPHLAGFGVADFPMGHWMWYWTDHPLPSSLQETMMDHPLRTISYIADIGNIVVLMARRRMPRSNSQENVEASHPSQDGKRQYKMICHVFESEDVRVASPSPSSDLSCPSVADSLFISQDLSHMCKQIFTEHLLCVTQPYIPVLVLGIQG